MSDKTIAESCGESQNLNEYVQLANATVLRLDKEKETLRKALQFIKELSGEAMENGDVRAGTAVILGSYVYRSARTFADTSTGNPT